MAKPTVIIVGADKGGVGKTTVSRTLIDYFTAHHVPLRAFDTETPKGTLKRFHPDLTEVVDMSSISDQMRIFDTLNWSDDAVTLIDMRAGLLSPTTICKELSGCSQATFDRYARKYDTPKKMGSVRFEEVEVSNGGNDLAHVSGRYVHRVPEAVNTGRFYLTLRRIGAQWVITRDQTTPDK